MQQLVKKLHEQGEDLRSAERCAKELQMQLLTKGQTESTVQRDLSQVKVSSAPPCSISRYSAQCTSYALLFSGGVTDSIFRGFEEYVQCTAGSTEAGHSMHAQSAKSRGAGKQIAASSHALYHLALAA